MQVHKTNYIFMKLNAYLIYMVHKIKLVNLQFKLIIKCDCKQRGCKFASARETKRKKCKTRLRLSTDKVQKVGLSLRMGVAAASFFRSPPLQEFIEKINPSLINLNRQL